jgi:hypothetical protein
MKPVQLKDSSPAEARPTPTMMGTRLSITGRGVASPRISLQDQISRQYSVDPDIHSLGPKTLFVYCSTVGSTGHSSA